MREVHRSGRLRPLALAGLLGLCLAAVAATHPGRTTALTITPASQDFGRVPVRSTGTIFPFKVRLPPGGGPADAVSVSITGLDIGDFRVPIQQFGTKPRNTCADSTWRTGSCDIELEFIPQRDGPRSATLLVVDTRGNRGTAALTGEGLFGCRPDGDVSCNYADHYSGTVSWTSELSTRSGNSSGPQYIALAIASVNVRVTDGAAFCTGSQSDSTLSLEAGRMDEMRKAAGVISGPGLFSIEFARDNNRMAYQVKAWCPTAEVTLTTHLFQSNETTTATSPARPARQGGSGGMTIGPEPARAIGVDLAGRLTMPHPDEDPSNGVTGKVTIVWDLKRN